jgi:hypothetical protein
MWKLKHFDKQDEDDVHEDDTNNFVHPEDEEEYARLA